MALKKEYQPLSGKSLEEEKEKLRKRKAKHLKKYYKRTDRTLATEKGVGSGLTAEELNKMRTKRTY